MLSLSYMKPGVCGSFLVLEELNIVLGIVVAFVRDSGNGIRGFRLIDDSGLPVALCTALESRLGVFQFYSSWFLDLYWDWACCSFRSHPDVLRRKAVTPKHYKFSANHVKSTQWIHAFSMSSLTFELRLPSTKRLAP